MINQIEGTRPVETLSGSLRGAMAFDLINELLDHLAKNDRRGRDVDKTAWGEYTQDSFSDYGIRIPREGHDYEVSYWVSTQQSHPRLIREEDRFIQLNVARLGDARGGIVLPQIHLESRYTVKYEDRLRFTDGSWSIDSPETGYKSNTPEAFTKIDKFLVPLFRQPTPRNLG